MDGNSSALSLIENKKEVPKEFNKIAARYDFTTAMSQGYQGDLNHSAGFLELKGDETVLDLCCGTGRSVHAILRHLPSGKIIGIDNSELMLEQAEKKFASEVAAGRVSFSLQDVMHMDLSGQKFSHIFMAYGLRNMPDYGKCLEILYNLLQPGGRLVMHDYALAERWYSRLYWWLLGYIFVVPIGFIFAGSSRIFIYLVRSVMKFLSPSEVEGLLREKGFREVVSWPQRSWRGPILRTFVAVK